MMNKGWIAGAAMALAGTMALGHAGVQNAAVKARMDGMSAIGASMKTLGGMAKGATPFDAATAQDALSAVSQEAGRILALFEPQQDDPKSESLPAIWTNWDDFTAKAAALETAAQASVQSLGDLQAAMGALGGTCKACHSAYRE